MSCQAMVSYLLPRKETDGAPVDKWKGFVEEALKFKQSLPADLVSDINTLERVLNPMSNSVGDLTVAINKVLDKKTSSALLQQVRKAKHPIAAKIIEEASSRLKAEQKNSISCRLVKDLLAEMESLVKQGVPSLDDLHALGRKLSRLQGVGADHVETMAKLLHEAFALVQGYEMLHVPAIFTDQNIFKVSKENLQSIVAAIKKHLALIDDMNTLLCSERSQEESQEDSLQAAKRVQILTTPLAKKPLETIQGLLEVASIFCTADSINDIPSVVSKFSSGTAVVACLACDLALRAQAEPLGAWMNTIVQQLKVVGKSFQPETSFAELVKDLVELRDTAVPLLKSAAKAFLEASTAVADAAEACLPMSDIDHVHLQDDGLIADREGLRDRLLATTSQDIFTAADNDMGLAQACATLGVGIDEQVDEGLQRQVIEIPLRLKVTMVLKAMYKVDALNGSTDLADICSKLAVAKNEIEAMISYLDKNVAHPVVRQVRQQLAPKCRSWASGKGDGILREMTLIVDSMKASVDKLQGKVPDFKDVVKKFDDAGMQQYCEMSERPALVTEIKLMNGYLARWREYTAAAAGMAFDGMAAITKQMDEHTLVRDKARSAIAVRAGLQILKNEEEHRRDGCLHRVQAQ